MQDVHSTSRNPIFQTNAYMGVLGIQDMFLPGIWGTIHFTYRNFRILCSIFRLLLGILKIEENYLSGYLTVYKGYLSVYFKGYGILVTPYASL